MADMTKRHRLPKRMQFIRSRAADFVAPVFKVQSFLNSWWSQRHNSVVDLKGGSCHQLEERFTANQTTLKYAESSSTPAPLSLTPSPPCLFLILTRYISGHALWEHFLCLPAKCLHALTEKVLVWDDKTILLFQLISIPVYHSSTQTGSCYFTWICSNSFHSQKVLNLSSFSNSLTLANHRLIQTIFHTLAYSVLPR